MNSEAFLNETIQYFRDEYSEFLTYQALVEEIFRVFDGLCQKHGIPYAVFFGSLIGEVRDGGMVPWDPDMDVCVSIDDVPRLLKALEESLPEGYFYVSNYTNSDFPYFEMKIGKEGYDVFRIHLDVFYLVGVPKGRKKAAFTKKMQTLCMMRYKSVESRKSIEEIQKFGGTRREVMLRKALYRVQSRFMSTKTLEKKFEKLCCTCAYTRAETLCVPEITVLCYSFDDIEPMKREFLNGREIGLPHSAEAVLNASYKNYREYPPIETRFAEYYGYMQLYRKTMGTEKKTDYYAK